MSGKRQRKLLLKIEKKESKKLKIFQKLLDQTTGVLVTIRAGRDGAVEKVRKLGSKTLKTLTEQTNAVPTLSEQTSQKKKCLYYSMLTLKKLKYFMYYTSCSANQEKILERFCSYISVYRKG